MVFVLFMIIVCISFIFNSSMLGFGLLMQILIIVGVLVFLGVLVYVVKVFKGKGEIDFVDEEKL